MPTDPSEVFEDLGKLDVEIKDLEEASEVCEENQEAVIGFLGIVGKVLREVFKF